MRLSGREADPVVGVVPGADIRPIRMNLAGNYYRMKPNEAIDLANRLADAVEQFRTTEGTAP